MDKYGGTYLAALLQNAEESSVVHMKRRAIIRHKDLNAGDPSLGKVLNFLKYAVHDICYHGVKGKVHAGFILCPGVDPVINGVKQAPVRILRRKIHNGSSSAYNGGVGGLITGGVPITHVAQGGKVGVLVYAARKHIFPLGIYHTICLLVQMGPHGTDDLTLHQDITHKLLFRGYNGASFDQGAHTVIS